MRRRPLLVLTMATVLALAFSIQASVATAAPLRMAAAELIDPAGNRVGFATFVELPSGKVIVFAHARGLTPGMHGMHVHTTGACTPTFAAAGGHFNPLGLTHGTHAGDLGNITANSAGMVNLIRITDQFTVSPGQFSLLDTDGSALVIHANADDLMTDPAGNSGDRVACGAIQPAWPR